jgi:hypothetical protein
MKTKNKIKNLRPIDLDLTLGYTCPTCSTTHWVRLNQAQYDKFVIVCDCDTILKPKVIENVKILYKKKKSPTNTKSEANQDQEIDPKILETCCKALFSYGFSKLEAQDLIKKAYATCKSLDCSTLIKLSLSNFGEKNG